MKMETESPDTEEVVSVASLSQPGSAILAPGTLVGSRFEVKQQLGQGGLGKLYLARDQKTDKEVALRLLAPDICEDKGVLQNIKEQVSLASALKQMNIIKSYGMAMEDDQAYIVSELITGKSLRELLNKRRESQEPFSLKGAYNVVAHLCNALEHAHETMFHGLVGAGSIRINKVGRIKLGEFGLLLALEPGSDSVTRLEDQYFLAPEMEADPAFADHRADIYSLGVLLYELITLQAPITPDSVPSEVQEGIPEEVDLVIARCLQSIPGERYENVSQLKAAFYAAITPGEGAGAPEAEADAILSGGPETSSQAEPESKPGESSPQEAPPPASANPFAMAPSTDKSAAPPTSGPVPAPTQQQIDLDAMLAEAVPDDREIWLVQKDRMDFGPFKLMSLKQAIYKNEFDPDSMLTNRETGERMSIRNHPVIKDFAVAVHKHYQQKIEQEADVQRWEKEKSRRTVLFYVVAFAIVVLGVGGVITAYLMTKDPVKVERIVYRDRKLNIEKLLSRIDVTWKKEPADQAKKRKRRRRKKAHAKAGTKAGEDVMYLGDATKAGGDALLSQMVVERVMKQNMKKLVGCVYAELRRNPSTKSVDIDFSVKGSGDVSYVKVNGQTSGPLFNCTRGRMLRIKFPKYDGTLTRASFSMSLK